MDRPSLFISEKPEQTFTDQGKKSGVNLELTLQQSNLSGIMEGIYIKVEDGDYVTDRLKFVRASFLSTILDSESHWLNRPMVANCLADRIDHFAFPEQKQDVEKR